MPVASECGETGDVTPLFPRMLNSFSGCHRMLDPPKISLRAEDSPDITRADEGLGEIQPWYSIRLRASGLSGTPRR